MADGTNEERTPPPDAAEPEAGQSQPGSSHANGSPGIIEQLHAVGNANPQELARIALGGASSDEVVPTAEGITLFRDERARQHRASGSSKSLLEQRLDRIKKTPHAGEADPSPQRSDQ